MHLIAYASDFTRGNVLQAYIKGGPAMIFNRWYSGEDRGQETITLGKFPVMAHRYPLLQED